MSRGSFLSSVQPFPLAQLEQRHQVPAVAALHRLSTPYDGSFMQMPQPFDRRLRPLVDELVGSRGYTKTCTRVRGQGNWVSVREELIGKTSRREKEREGGRSWLERRRRRRRQAIKRSSGREMRHQERQAGCLSCPASRETPPSEAVTRRV